MLDSIRNNRRVVQIILVLVALTLLLFGVESYVSNMGSSNNVASVGKWQVTPQEFDQALRDQRDRLIQMSGGQVDPAMLETPEFRQAVIDQIVNQRLLVQEAARARILVSDQQLQKLIGNISAFQEDGKFSQKNYEAALNARGMTPAVFEARARQDLAVQQLVGSVMSSGVVSNALVDRWAEFQNEQRMVSEAVVVPQPYVTQVKLDAAAVRAYYDKNPSLFARPEQAKVEYVVFSAETLVDGIKVEPAEVKRQYDEHRDRYQVSEQRHAAHILITAPKGAPEATVKAARTKAEEVLKKVRANPADFAKLAAEFSQDPGSRERGGDLGFFGRNAMVPAFENAVFALKKGQISDLVQSDFGFHIIRLDDIKAGEQQAFDAVKAGIELELKKEKAAKKFTESAETFNNVVYEQADSLKPVAEKLGLEVRASDWLAKEGSSRQPMPFSNAKLLDAIFAADSLKNKRNTAAVEVAPGYLVSARVVDYHAASQTPFEDVRAMIEQQLTREEAAKMAAKEGEAKLAQLNSGAAVDVKWSESRPVVRQMLQGQGAAVVGPIFRAPIGKLPTYVGVSLPDGSYGLYRIDSAGKAEGDAAAAVRQAAAQQLASTASTADLAGYLGSLKARYPVTVNQGLLNKAKN